MRLWYLPIFAVAVSGTVHAQPPVSPNLSFPFSMQGTLQNDDETSCSQSFANETRRADITLTVDRSGRATLTSDAHSRSRSGPSRGRFSEGERGTSVLQSHDRVELVGRARRDGDRLTVTFERSEHAAARWQGEGVLPLAAPVSAPSTSVLSCSLTPTEVYPALPAEGEQAITMSVLACSFDQQPPGLENFGIPTLRLLPGPGIATRREASSWQASPTETVRRVR